MKLQKQIEGGKSTLLENLGVVNTCLVCSRRVAGEEGRGVMGWGERSGRAWASIRIWVLALMEGESRGGFRAEERKIEVTVLPCLHFTVSLSIFTL